MDMIWAIIIHNFVEMGNTYRDSNIFFKESMKSTNKLKKYAWPPRDQYLVIGATYKGHLCKGMIYIQRSSWWRSWSLLPLGYCSLPFHKGYVKNNKHCVNWKWAKRVGGREGGHGCVVSLWCGGSSGHHPTTPYFPNQLHSFEINWSQLILIFNY